MSHPAGERMTAVRRPASPYALCRLASPLRPSSTVVDRTLASILTERLRVAVTASPRRVLPIGEIKNPLGVFPQRGTRKTTLDYERPELLICCAGYTAFSLWGVSVVVLWS